MSTTNNEFKHGLRLQLNDCKELLKYIEEDDKDRATEKLKIMIDTLQKSLED